MESFILGSGRSSMFTFEAVCRHEVATPQSRALVSDMVCDLEQVEIYQACGLSKVHELERDPHRYRLKGR